MDQPGGHHRPGIARRDDRLNIPRGQQRPAFRDRIVPLFSQRLDGLVLHADDLAGMHDRQAVARRVGHAGQLGLDGRPIADQNDCQGLVLSYRAQGPRHDWAGGVVASHGIQGDPHGTIPHHHLESFHDHSLGKDPFFFCRQAPSSGG